MDEAPDRGVELMLELQEGREAAFEEIVELYQGQIFGLLRRVLGPAAAIEDLAQETFLRLYRARGRYRPQGKLGTFLYRIAYNLALNRFRDDKRRREVAMPRTPEGVTLELGDARAEEPWADPDRQDWACRVARALARLPENQRTALVLQHFDELDLEQIGEVLGISAKAAKSLLHRARTGLRDLLAPFREAEHD